MMLKSAQVTPITSDTLSIVPVVRSASDTHALGLLELVLEYGTDERYIGHPEFARGFQDGYVSEEALGAFQGKEIVLADVLKLVEEHFSLSVLQYQNQQLTRLHLSLLTYEYCVGFALGFLRWLFDAERAPWLSLPLLQTWYRIEYLTRSLAVRYDKRQLCKQSMQLVHSQLTFSGRDKWAS